MIDFFCRCHQKIFHLKEGGSSKGYREQSVYSQEDDVMDFPHKVIQGQGGTQSTVRMTSWVFPIRSYEVKVGLYSQGVVHSYSQDDVISAKS